VDRLLKAILAIITLMIIGAFWNFLDHAINIVKTIFTTTSDALTIYAGLWAVWGFFCLLLIVIVLVFKKEGGAYN
jgi:hypothetical protein